MTRDVNEQLREFGPDTVRDTIDHAEKYERQPRFKLQRFNDIMISTPPNYFVKGIIPRFGLTVIWGPPKCGKSFLTFDVMMHVALGWRYHGYKVQQGTTVYLALEGGGGFSRRVEAWRRKHLSSFSIPAMLAPRPCRGRLMPRSRSSAKISF